MQMHIFLLFWMIIMPTWTLDWGHNLSHLLLVSWLKKELEFVDSVGEESGGDARSSSIWCQMHACLQKLYYLFAQFLLLLLVEGFTKMLCGHVMSIEACDVNCQMLCGHVCLQKMSCLLHNFYFHSRGFCQNVVWSHRLSVAFATWRKGGETELRGQDEASRWTPARPSQERLAGGDNLAGHDVLGGGEADTSRMNLQC